MLVFYCFTVWLFAWVSVCSGDDVVVQMFSKKPVNVISEKYISYSIDPTELLEMKKEESFVYRMMESGPCYLKIYGNNTNKMRLDGNSIDLDSTKLSLDRLKSVYQVLRSADIKPVIALPYNPKNWNTRNVMRILGKVSLLEMNDITWQLGADFHAKDAISYIDDLNTLKLIVGAFATKESQLNWSVVGSDITIGSSEDEARMYSEFSKYIVDAVGWSQAIELNYNDENIDDFFSNLNIDSALRTILNGESPIWLTLLQKNVDAKTPLTHMKQGLNWAQILGDAAKNGFKVIYSPINKNTWYEPSMSYYTTLLHRRIMGQTVFDTKMFNGNRFDSHFYAHCTKNMSGSFTLFGVNAAESSLDITAKLPFRSGTEYKEFILTTGVNGKVFLNGAEIIEPTVLTAVDKYKLPGKGALLSMPAHSVAFWVFTGANIPECASTDIISFEMEQTQQRTSSELLLQQLIVESVLNEEVSATSDEENSNSSDEENAITRSKRHAITKKDGFVSRIRRDVENTIDKHSEYNAIEMDDVDIEAQTRDKRFIGDGNLVNRIYNDLDDLKRRSLVAPYKSKLPLKRMKRDINMLKNLFDKFDLKKSAFNFKTPTLKLGSKSLIPTISTVHDVLNPSTVEKRIFDPVENPELPSGDVHFEIAEAVTEPNEYAAALNAANKIVERTPSFIASNPSFDAYANAGLAPPAVPVNSALSNAVPLSASLGELTEIDGKPEIVTAPSIQSVAPIPAPVPVQPVQHQIQYVVKDLPPTWQVNRENMEKARNNLRQNLWPMSMNVAQTTNPKPITAFLPNVAPIQSVQPDEMAFFESKRRRRRAIDSKMNEEIERRVQRDGVTTVQRETQLGEAISHVQVELLDKMIRLIDDLERSQNNVLRSGNDIGLGKILADRRAEASENNAPKKCKILSMAMEKQCLETESQPKTLFKRAIEGKRNKKTIGPLKKLFAKIKDNVEKPLRFRARRSAEDFDEPILSDENEINSILKELNSEEAENEINSILKELNSEEAENTRRKLPVVKVVELETSSTTTPSTTTTTTTTTSSSITTTTEQNVSRVTKTKERVKKLWNAVKGSADSITNLVARQIGNVWYSFY